MAFAFSNSSGEIQYIAHTSIDYTEGNIYVGLLCSKIPEHLEVTQNFTELYYYFEGFHPYPSKTSPHHTWNLDTRSWEITQSSLDTVKEQILQGIEVRRVNLSLQPIVYSDKALDADTQAQSNINGKLQEIFAREAAGTPLTSGQMFWKDADNVVHSWDTQNAYKAWLQGLVIAISSRNTALYATAWTKKAELEALTDINAIVNYDVSVGWII